LGSAVAEEAPALLTAMTRLVTAYTKPTQDALSEGSAAIMDVMVPMTMTMTMTMTVSAVTTVTTVLMRLGQFSVEYLVQNALT
jgi:hypothetical protein